MLGLPFSQAAPYGLQQGYQLGRGISLSILHRFHPLSKAHGFILCSAELFGLFVYFCTCLIMAVCECFPVHLAEIVLILVLRGSGLLSTISVSD